MAKRVSDLVRELVPTFRHTINANEQALAIHLRGNKDLYEQLITLITSRIQGRANLPEPSDSLVCKSMIARDRELMWLMSRLEAIYHLPRIQPVDESSEQPE